MVVEIQYRRSRRGLDLENRKDERGAPVEGEGGKREPEGTCCAH